MGYFGAAQQPVESLHCLLMQWRKGLALAEKRVPRSLSAAASVRYIRMQQVSAMSDKDVANLLSRSRQSKTIPKLDYHFRKHGAGFGARDEQEYLRRLQEYLSGKDLRIFTCLRGRRQVPFWEMIDLDSGTTVLYNENEHVVWSFYRMPLPEHRLRRYQSGLPFRRSRPLRLGSAVLL